MRSFVLKESFDLIQRDEVVMTKAQSPFDLQMKQGMNKRRWSDDLRGLEVE